MSSTILCRAGSEGNAPELELGPAAAAAVESLLDGRGGDGGGGDEGDVDDDEDASVVAVASARARTNDSVLLLCAETLCGWIGPWSVHIRLRGAEKKVTEETAPLTSRGHAQSNKR